MRVYQDYRNTLMRTGSDFVEAKKNRTTKSASIIGLFVVAIIWGSTFTANKIALGALTPLSLMAIRFTLAFVIMVTIFRKKFVGIRLKDLRGGILCGISLFLAFILQTYGLLYTNAGKQAFLSGAYVIAVPFLTWITFKAKPSLKVYLGTVICFLGIALISLQPGFKIELGDFMTIVSSLFFAAQIVIAGYFVKSENPAVMSTVQFGVMGGLSFVAALLIGDFAFLSIGKNMFAISSLSVTYLGIIGTAVAYYLQILCQKYASPTTTSIILSLEAVFGAILAMIILGEAFTLRIIVGAIAIFVAILISEL